MIDAVITWVDGDDPKHIQKRAFFLKHENKENLRKGAAEKTRFANNNEIWYCIKLIRKNAAWINNIFLVTDDQKPKWLDTKLQKELNISIIDHRIIFAGYEDYLPTFNATTIETMLFKIPGLSDNFLYFNDDVFLTRPTKREDYFRGNKLAFRGTWRFMNRYLYFLQKKYESYKKKEGYVGLRGNAKFFPTKQKLFMLAHAPYPLNKHALGNIFLGHIALINQIKHRFRNKRQLHTIGLAANIALQNKQAKVGANDWGYISSLDYYSDAYSQKIHIYKKNKNIKSVCIQSLDAASPAQQHEIMNFLKGKLNDN